MRRDVLRRCQQDAPLLRFGIKNSFTIAARLEPGRRATDLTLRLVRATEQINIHCSFRKIETAPLVIAAAQFLPARARLR